MVDPRGLEPQANGLYALYINNKGVSAFSVCRHPNNGIILYEHGQPKQMDLLKLITHN
jgi:hypothetical protein